MELLKQDLINKLINRLEDIGVWNPSDVDYQNILDSLWLAMQMGGENIEIVASQYDIILLAIAKQLKNYPSRFLYLYFHSFIKPSPPVKSTDLPSPRPGRKSPESQPPTQSNSADLVPKDSSKEIEKETPTPNQESPESEASTQSKEIEKETTETSTASINKSLPFRVRAASGLQEARQITRALRPLMRKVPSTTKVMLDTEATVNLIAERDIWQAVTKPQPERWLTLELVVESSQSTFIWQELISELQQLLETQGAFKTIRVWTLSQADTDSLQLVRRKKGSKSLTSSHSHRELIHSDGRCLVLLISDCVSPIWKSIFTPGKTPLTEVNKYKKYTIYDWLQAWSEKQPTAIIQLFPERLWNSTQLARGEKFFVTSFTAGVANPQLYLKDYPRWLPLDWQNSLLIPVISLQAEVIKSWSRVVAGGGDAEISAFLYDLNFVREQIEISPQPPQNTPPDKPIKLSEVEAEEKAKAIVERFFATASESAQQLATMMAAVPVDMNVINLLRKTLLPKVLPEHIAEFYMGGLLTSNDLRVYNFLPGIRKVLNKSIGSYRTTIVLDAISEYIGQEIDYPLRSFEALLTKLPEFTDEQQQQVFPFAKVALEVLTNLGGKYAEFAQDIETSLQDRDTGEDEDEKTFITDVAEIQLLLEFETVFVNRQGEIIERKTCEAKFFPQFLNESTSLTMIEIPEGKFMMGSPETEKDSYDDERPQHPVTVSKFYLSQTPITESQWQFVAGLPQEGKELNQRPSNRGDNHPVTKVSWYDAVEFCARLSRYTGRNYRLPSEAEWEYACRAGTTTPFHFGETIRYDLACYYNKAVYQKEAVGKNQSGTKEVGNFYPNAFGLYDMHGNVLEWCGDSWHSHYQGAPNNSVLWDDNEVCDNDYLNDISKLLELTNSRVRRGGSWMITPWNCRSAYRYDSSAGYINGSIGFRVAFFAL